MAGGSGTVISNLTVHGASMANVAVRQADRVTIRRVRATAGVIGISVQGGHTVRVENIISDGNRYGIVVAGGIGHTVVNCTAVGNSSLGMSFPSGEGTVAFNNVVTESTVAVNVGEVKHLTLDYNLYLGMNIGKCAKVAAQRESLNDWQYVSGQDRHSISLPVQYANPARGRFAVINPLAWALNRTVTAGWGQARLTEQTAPVRDIDGSKRPGTPGLGAFETSAVAPRPPDGDFLVPDGPGLTSAGVFDADGKLISYLFQMLPLAAGKYPCWLPARSYVGKPIAPGSYTVRVVKGDLTWKYLGWFGNTDHRDAAGYGGPCGHTGLAFDNEGRLFVGNVTSDVMSNLRAADTNGQWLWTQPSIARAPGPALAVAKDGLLYTLRNMPGLGMSVSHIQPATGKVAQTGGEEPLVLKNAAGYTGMTVLAEQLCYTDTKNNAVLFGSLTSPAPEVSVAVTAPACPAADATGRRGVGNQRRGESGGGVARGESGGGSAAGARAGGAGRARRRAGGGLEQTPARCISSLPATRPC